MSSIPPGGSGAGKPPAMRLPSPILPATAAPPSGKIPAVKDIAAARKVGEQFEAMFVGQMVAHMFEGIGDDPITGGGEGGKMYRSMLQEEYGKVIAKSGGLGVADSVMREVLKLQEKAKP